MRLIITYKNASLCVKTSLLGLPLWIFVTSFLLWRHVFTRSSSVGRTTSVRGNIGGAYSKYLAADRSKRLRQPRFFKRGCLRKKATSTPFLRNVVVSAIKIQASQNSQIAVHTKFIPPPQQMIQLRHINQESHGTQVTRWNEDAERTPH